MRTPALLLAVLELGCGSSSAPLDAAAADTAPRLEGGDRSLVDGPREAGGTAKAKDCAASFGQALTAAFGRLDGTLLAVVTPADAQCAQPNSDHLVLQVTMNGAAYRAVVNISSTGADPKVRFAELERPLPGPAWSEGWHLGVALDYVSTLSVHSTSDFAPYEMSALVTEVSDRLTLGQPISVYATSTGGDKADSAHLVHRNKTDQDGAIVVDPTGSKPRLLLFHFADQTF